MSEAFQKKRYIESYLADRNGFIKTVGGVEAKDPNMPEGKKQALRAIVTEFRHQELAFARELEGVNAKNQQEFVASANGLRGKYEVAIRDKIMAEHPAFGPDAWKVVAAASQPENFWTSLLKNFYDSEKGGLQIGSLLGAGIATFIGYKVTHGSGLLMSALGIGAGVVLGTLIGGRFDGDGKTTPMPDFYTKAMAEKAPPHVRGKEKHVYSGKPGEKHGLPKGTPVASLDPGIMPVADTDENTNSRLPLDKQYVKANTNRSGSGPVV